MDNKVLRKNRSRAKISGTADRPRLSVFRSNRFVYAQLIDDEKGKTLAAVSVKDFPKEKKKMTKTEQAKLAGEILADKAKKLNIQKAVFHKSFYRYHGRIKALADGARSGGLQF